MSTLMPWSGQLSLGCPSVHVSRKRIRPARPRPPGLRSARDRGRPGGTPRPLSVHRRGECIRRALGPADPEHVFVIRLDSESTLRIALASTCSMAGLQLVRSAADSVGGRTDPANVLATTSTLVTNPATLVQALEAGEYLVRVYNFFDDACEYLLEVSSRHASQATVVVDGHRHGRLSGAMPAGGPSATVARGRRPDAPNFGIWRTQRIAPRRRESPSARSIVR